MYNVAFRIVNQTEIAEEIMQDSFLKAFIKLDSYSGKVTFGAWLKKIVIHNSINELKKINKYPFETISEHLSEEIEETFEIESWNELKANHILKIMQELKPNYKLILTLFFIEGYDLEEIATILSISNENCRTTMSRAKTSLRKKHTEYVKS
jgi:RNA polymerase sigma-70 factor (ECF subfamily)